MSLPTSYCTLSPVSGFEIFFSDVTCPVLPPDVPTSNQYTLPADDGYVVAQSVIYPTYPTINRNDQTLNSTHPRTRIPSNFRTNLT